MATLTSALKRFDWLYAYALGAGLTPMGRSLRERAAECGLNVRFSWGKIWVKSNATEIGVAARHAAHVWGFLPNWAGLIRRLQLNHGTAPARTVLKFPQRYRVPGGNDWVWLPTLPEAEDFLVGYFQKCEPAAGDIVFDAGAYCGEATLALARKVGPTGRVIAFEPDAQNLIWLRRNLSEAGVENVTIIERGLWCENTRLRFVAKGNFGSQLLAPHEPDVAGMTEIAVVDFAEACRLAGAVPSFVKMDIEGAEIEVIAGARDFIRAHRIHFAIASYHERDGGRTCDQLEPMFRELGYQAETGNPNHTTTWAWKT